MKISLQQKFPDLWYSKVFMYYDYYYNLRSREPCVPVLNILMNNPNIDLDCATVDGIGPLHPLHMTTSPSCIRLLLEHGAIPTYEMYRNYYPNRLLKDPADMSVKIFVLGDPGVGKSTLIKSLKTETEGLFRLISLLVKVKDVDTQTAGIVPYDINSISLGRITCFDFAGHREFYAGHDAVLHNSMSNSPAIILLVVNIGDSEDKVRATISYWLDFINSCLEKSTSIKPHLVIIYSHADKTRDRNLKLSLAESLVESHYLDSYTYLGNAVMDCRFATSASMKKLRSILIQSCQELRSHMSRNVSIETHCFLVFLRDKFRGETAITIDTATAGIKDEPYLKFLQSCDLCKICEQLNQQGNILFMKNHDDPRSSWIVLDKAILLSHVNGLIFAPEGFKEYVKVATSTGVVPLSKLYALFQSSGFIPKLDLNMIIQFLCHLEFCQEITDIKILSHLSFDKLSLENERYFFFPGLVYLDRPQDLWHPNVNLDYHSGWLLKCSNSRQFFTPRFLYVLLLRIAFHLALAPSELSNSGTDHLALQRKCSIWKNGIAWANLSGGEAIVEIIDQKQVVVVSRCNENIMESLKLRSNIIRIVLEAKDEICPRVLVREALIFPSDIVNYPLDLTNIITVSIKDVVQTIKEEKNHIIIKTHQPVKLEELLPFEPYASVGLSVLHKLFNECKSEYCQKIIDDFIKCIVNMAQSNITYFTELFELHRNKLVKDGPQRATHHLVQVLQLWRKEKGMKGTCICCELRKKLDDFSIFAGRNPLNLTEATGIIIIIIFISSPIVLLSISLGCSHKRLETRSAKYSHPATGNFFES